MAAEYECRWQAVQWHGVAAPGCGGVKTGTLRSLIKRGGTRIFPAAAVTGWIAALARLVQPCGVAIPPRPGGLVTR